MTPKGHNKPQKALSLLTANIQATFLNTQNKEIETNLTLTNAKANSNSQEVEATLLLKGGLESLTKGCNRITTSFDIISPLVLTIRSIYNRVGQTGKVLRERI